MILSWVFVLHIPRALSATGTSASQSEWTALFEATAFAGIALALGESGQPLVGRSSGSPEPQRGQVSGGQTS